MSEQWFREYVLLAFRIDKAIRKFSESRFVDYYCQEPNPLLGDGLVSASSPVQT